MIMSCRDSLERGDMFKSLGLIMLALLVGAVAVQADIPPCAYSLDCPPTYFLVAEIEPLCNDSYAVLISNPLDILHAYELIEFGSGFGSSIVGATVSCWDSGDGINVNRNYTEPGCPSWSWYAEFVAFAGGGAEICDGRPLWEEGCCEVEHNIWYWAYTVVAELGSELDPWCRVLDADCVADFNDLEIIASNCWIQVVSTRTGAAVRT